MSGRTLSEKQRESDLQSQVLAWLKLKGFWHWRAYNGATLRGGGNNPLVMTHTQNPGMPDIHGVTPCGRLFMIELKRPGWKPPREPRTLKLNPTWTRHCLQREWIERCNAHGGIGFFATSLETVIEKLDHYANRGTGKSQTA